MSALTHLKRQTLDALLALSARAEILSVVRRGKRGVAHLGGAQRALQVRLARTLGVVSTQDLARLEARLELLKSTLQTLRQNTSAESETPTGHDLHTPPSSSSALPPLEISHVGSGERVRAER